MSKFKASNGITVSSETQGITGFRRIKFETELGSATVEISGRAMAALIEALDFEREDEARKIPSTAEYITWCDPGDNGEERIAMRYGHHANRVWRMGMDTFDEDELVHDFIGDAPVTVLVVKAEEE